MSAKILYVDDDPNILAGCKRVLGRKLNITTATSGAEGLEIMRTSGPFAVVLSDMRMPGMNGIEFICNARAIAAETVYMMLTGNSDQETAMDAVNKGQVFRFLTKPCPQEIVGSALQAGIKQYQLVTAERELLQKTLTGSIRALSEAMSLVNPKAFARGTRIKPIVTAVVGELKLEHAWRYEIAALLSQIGSIVLPPDIVERVYSGSKLLAKESEVYESHPKSGAALLAHIPRLEQCARMIEHQLIRYDANEKPDASTPPGEALLGSQIIRAASDFDALIHEGHIPPAAVAQMKQDTGDYNPDVLAALARVPLPGVVDASAATVMKLTVSEITPGMYAHKPIVTTSGTLLVPKGGEITPALVQRLRNFAGGVGVVEPLHMLVPHAVAASAA